MKKLSYLMCGLAMAGMMFTGCNKGGDEPTPSSLSSGVYVLGEATGFADVNATDASKTGMAVGINEVDKQAREGMYEKYIVLEAGKDFQFLFKTGDTLIYYGAQLAEAKLPTDGVELDGYAGLLKVGEKCQVTKTGFYHIILDLCIASELPGGPQVVIAPAEIGIAGAMNSWGYTIDETAAAVKAGDVAFERNFKGIEMLANAEFKFKTSNCWKINLDSAELVKAETSMGIDMVVGAGNIVVTESGIYDIKASFSLAKGAIDKSFTYTLTKVGDVQIKDYSNCQMELVGAAVAEQTGSEPDLVWTWGNRFPMGKPVKDGNIYTWKVEGVHMLAGEFKVRTVNFEAQGDIAAFDNGSNQTITSEDDYDITFTLNAATNEKNVLIEGGVPPVTQIITVRAKMPSNWQNTPTAWVWYEGEGGAAVALTQNGEWWSYTTPVEVPTLGIIFRNGADWSGDANQTVDLQATEDTCWELAQEGAAKATASVATCPE